MAVATTLVGNPVLLFLDEPTTGLDPRSRRELWGVITEFRGQGGTVLLTTHYMDEAERLCDRVAIFDHGLIIAVDSPRNLIAGLGADHIIEFGVGASGTSPLAANFGTDLQGVSAARMDAGLHCLSAEQVHVVIPTLLARLRELELELTNLSTRQATLEDVFVRFTEQRLDDDQEAS